MDTHKNARLTPKGREDMVRAVVDGGLTKAAAARRYNTTPKTVAKWVERFRKEGVEGLRDRSSRPHSSPDQTPPATCDAIEVLRRQRYTGKQIAAKLGVSPATVSRILRRRGLNKLAALEPAEPVRRYEREQAGRAHPHRHQKARQVQPDRPSHHRRPQRPEQQPRGRLGVRPRLHRRSLAHRLRRASCPIRRSEVPQPSSRPRSLITQASASRSSA